jgi:membrane-bound metal-dependent hydrolase YbcI (DUF457 family)
MPFTPTHALAVVPLARVGWLVPSGLVIGSMVPDLPMFLPGTPSYSTTHAWPSGGLACLPYGLILFVLFRLCRGGAIGFGPCIVRRRLAAHAAPDLRMSVGSWMAVALSIVLGVWTHILWDGFTHAGRFGSVLWPELSRTWLTLGGASLPGYKLLQYGSSAVGLPLLGVVIARWYAWQAESQGLVVEPATLLRRGAAILLLIGAPVAAAALGWPRWVRTESNELYAYYVITRTIGVYLFGAVTLTLSSPFAGVRH